MKSMTGFGRGSAQADGCMVQVEISTVNRKNLDVQANLPRPYAGLEALVQKKVAQALSRGRIHLRITVDAPRGRGRLTLDMERAADMMQLSRELAEHLGVEPIRQANDLLRMPEILRTEESELPLDTVSPLLEQALELALDDVTAMRTREGEHLRSALETPLARMAELAAGVEPLLPAAREALVAKLREGLAALDAPSGSGDPRLLQEIALYADRSDVTEELDRIRAHLDQAAERLGSDEPVGRALDFIAQELAREFNTLSVKSGSVAINRLALEGKETVEIFREQVQNVE